MSIARCGEGSGSLPVPCRPETRPTASIFTGKHAEGHGQVADRMGLIVRSIVGRFRLTRGEKAPRRAAGQQRGGAQQEEGASFHASMHRKLGRRNQIEHNQGGTITIWRHGVKRRGEKEIKDGTRKMENQQDGEWAKWRGRRTDRRITSRQETCLPADHEYMVPGESIPPAAHNHVAASTTGYFRLG